MGLRPSFGRVSRYGCMTLAWSMDKVGPIARHAIDCGIVLNAIQGTDGMDPTVVDRPCLWPTIDIKKLRVGYVEKQLSDSEQLVLDKLKSEGAIIVPIEFPSTIPQGALMVGLDVESGACMTHSFEPQKAMPKWDCGGHRFASRNSLAVSTTYKACERGRC